ncbi:McrB family protein [Fibrobacter sp. UWH4]|uniref:McrB family protein n=1 Tax=Fibrobacter sp. UWH4 TaxID=1896210 RepID=UPI0009240778|nr:AAA family ATPase [Fibrobacter sp. UWH4]SHL80372.1 AAA domain (dynein-related subfamily) [Fibrobacter sp. UWH4]
MNVNLEEKIIAFLNGYLEEAKKKFSFLKGDKIAGKTRGYFFNSNKNGLLTGTYVGVSVDYESNKLNVFLRFWEEEEKEKNYENIEKKLNILEGHSREFQNLLGVDVWYHHYEKQVRGFMSDNDDGIRGFSVTFPAYKKLGKEIKNDLDTALSAIKLMKGYIEEPLTDDSDANDKTLLEKIQIAMDAQSEGLLARIKLGNGFLQYKPVNANSNDWRDSACHYEFREDGKGNMQICFHCESKFSNQIEFKKLVEKEESFKSSFFGNKTTIDYKRIPLSSGKIVDEAVDGMLEFEKKYGSKILKLIQKSKGVISSGISNNGEKEMSVFEANKEKIELNTILYGPPGTGKTFNTMAYAVAICEDKDVEEIKKEMKENYDSVKQRYDALKDEGRIEFVTFHQSYGYEDFIEGIKPDLDDSTGTLKYKLETGRFKAFCDKISGNFDDAWGVLCDKLDDEDKEYLEIPYISDKNKTFAIEWNVSHNGLKAKDAHRFFNKKQLQNIYRKKPGVKKGGHDNYRKAIVEYMKKECGLKEFNGDESNDLSSNARVFIIDEINRGNISKIFGELITLIEPSKRLGEKENLKVTLPCSGDEFGVPNNVYILGTMNTADRSIAMMDTALRRRFNFVEMMPDTGVLRNDIGDDIGIDVCKMLETINKRIEYLYDREHTIGHAFFLNVKTFDDLKLVFKNKVIPLLQEYFYDDYEKIRLVLGDNGKDEVRQFITKVLPQEDLFKKGEDDEDLNTEKYIYQINQDAFDNPESYKDII